MQLVDVAQHLRFGVVAVEDRVGQVGALALVQRLVAQVYFGGQGVDVNFALFGAKGGEELGQVGNAGYLIQRDANRAVVVQAQVGVAGQCFGDDGGLLVGASGDLQGVKNGVGVDGVAELDQSFGQHLGEQAHAFGNALEAAGAVVDSIHGGDDGQQHLRGADVAGGALAADVLFAGLQGQAQGGVALGVDGDADDPAGELAFEGFAGGHVGGVRPAIAHGHAKALAAAHGDIGSEPGRGAQ